MKLNIDWLEILKTGLKAALPFLEAAGGGLVTDCSLMDVRFAGSPARHSVTLSGQAFSLFPTTVETTTKHKPTKVSTLDQDLTPHGGTRTPSRNSAPPLTHKTKSLTKLEGRKRTHNPPLDSGEDDPHELVRRGRGARAGVESRAGDVEGPLQTDFRNVKGSPGRNPS